MPRTIKRFSGLMAQLMTKMKIKSQDQDAKNLVGGDMLLEIVNGSVKDYIP